MWRSATSEDVYLETDRFMEFMDRVLLLRDMSKLKKFYLVCDGRCGRTRVNAWISDIVKCKVEELIVCSKSQVPYSPFFSPSSIFTCDSLVRLTISMPCDLKLPALIHFPRLKVLPLMHITFRDKNFPEEFISNCPVLDELSIEYCTWEAMEDFIMSAPNLKTLRIQAPKGVIRINAPNLTHFEYEGRIAKEYDVHRFSSLVNAEIDFCMYLEDKDDIETRREELGYAVMKLSERLSSVRFLTLSFETHKALSLVDNLNARLPAFNNLRYLEVSYICYSRYYKSLLCLLEISPKLKSVNFMHGFGGRLSENGIEVVLPPIVFSKLKKVTFGSFKGDEMELILAEFFLKNAKI